MNDKILNLVNAYKLLPGIGQKNAERLAFYTLEMDSEQIEYISNTIINTYKGVKKCNICNNYTDNENGLCDICIDEDRENKVLCIVEDPKIVYFMEKNKIFPGKYFVLFHKVNNFRIFYYTKYFIFPIFIYTYITKTIFIIRIIITNITFFHTFICINYSI